MCGWINIILKEMFKEVLIIVESLLCEHVICV